MRLVWSMIWVEYSDAIEAECIYGLGDDLGKRTIEKFIEETSFYWKMNLDELLSFETPSKTVGIVTVEIAYDNGEEAVIDIIDKFSKICDLINN